MTTATSVETYREQAAQMFHDVFELMLRLDVQYVPEDDEMIAGQVTSAVYFAGPWKGATFLDCSLPLALLFTSRLMPDCEPTAMDDDVRDAMGELANIVGGNLKPLLPQGVELSMPSVVEGSNYSLRLCGENSFLRLPFVCEAGKSWVTIVEVNRE